MVFVLPTEADYLPYDPTVTPYSLKGLQGHCFALRCSIADVSLIVGDDDASELGNVSDFTSLHVAVDWAAMLFSFALCKHFPRGERPECTRDHVPQFTAVFTNVRLSVEKEMERCQAAVCSKRKTSDSHCKR